MDYVFGDKLSKDQLTVLRTRFDGIRAVLSEGVYDPSDCHGYVSREVDDAGSAQCSACLLGLLSLEEMRQITPDTEQCIDALIREIGDACPGTEMSTVSDYMKVRWFLRDKLVFLSDELLDAIEAAFMRHSGFPFYQHLASDEVRVLDQHYPPEMSPEEVVYAIFDNMLAHEGQFVITAEHPHKETA